MKSDYVKEYSRLETSHWWFVVRKKIILQCLRKYIPAGENKKVLNIGAAGGATSQWLAEFGKVSSIENEPLFLEHLRNNNIDVINADATQLPFADNSFDIVCAFDVVEHIENDTQALAEMQRVCRPGGKICITVPAFQTLWGRHDVANNHKRRYTFSSLRQQLPQKITVHYSTYFNTILFLPVYIARKVDWLINRNKPASSDFTSFKAGSLSGAVAKFIFGLELPLLKRIRLPFGVSLLLLLEKDISEYKD